MPRKKNLIIGLVVFVLVIGAFLAVVSRDAKEIQDTDLAPTTLESNEIANGFYLLAKAADELYRPKNQSEAFSKLINTEGWDEELATSLVASNIAALRLFNEAIRFQNIQIPTDILFNGNSEVLGACKDFARLKVIQSKIALQQGDWKTATNALADAIHFGGKLQSSHPPLLIYMLGLAVKSIALKQMEQISTHPEATTEKLQDLIVFVSQQQTGLTALTNTWKTEYQFTKQTTKNLTIGLSTSAGTFDQAVSSFTFQQTRTINALANGVRECINNLARHRTEMRTPYMSTEIKRRNVVMAFLRGNAMGEANYKMAFSAWLAQLNRKCVEKNNTAALQIILALRCHELEHGSLPTSLGELVPKYLPQVPLDDFDGQPFRYLPERKLIYSIGDNLQDDGGADLDSKGKRLDQVFQIPF